MAEATLARAVSGVEGAYFRSDLLECRRRDLHSWAAYLTGSNAKKVDLYW